MSFKGTAYVGQAKMGFGGLHSQSSQPKAAWTGGSKVTSNMGKSPVSSKGSMLGKKWKSTCKDCGGKM